MREHILVFGYSVFQTRSASSAKRKPASPRKRPTTLHEGGALAVNAVETNKKEAIITEESLRKVKTPDISSSSSINGSTTCIRIRPQNECLSNLTTSTAPRSFPFPCDLAALTGIQALANLSSGTSGETVADLERRPDSKLEKKPISTSLENPDLTSLCPDLAKANALISSNAAVLAATMNSFLLAGTVSDTMTQVPSNRDLLAAFAALGVVPFLGDLANVQGNEG
ncbi:unnamed protein product [Enterobius vermicularis]|uniref:Uncharacterized protein n=1 Tax=Enterobius vermicularis TaxID=51028 RepID=A0A0N4VQQ0_ENTVE|nr:unnamed protein product [Enterobius vermicularis]